VMSGKKVRWIVKKKGGKYYIDYVVNVPELLLRSFNRFATWILIKGYDERYRKLEPLADLIAFVLRNTWHRTKWFDEALKIEAELLGLLDRLDEKGLL